VEFVTATALLRSSNYHISPQSLFDAKGMAGNIVHAVATTNAIVGGLIVIEAFKVLRAGVAKKQMTINGGGNGDGGSEGGVHPPSTPSAYKYTFVKQHKSNNRWGAGSYDTIPTLTIRICNDKRQLPRTLEALHRVCAHEQLNNMTKCRRPIYCFRYFVLFSLFGSIWKHLDTDCFRYFAPF
jgi:hypothetical protein